MRQKRTYVKCARLLPYQRQCQDCSYKDYALRNKIDNHEEKATIMFNEDAKDHIKNSMVLSTNEEEMI